MKKVAILGSTGSIGTQTLEVIDENPDQFCAVALSCEKNIELLIRQIEKYKPEMVVTASETDALALSKKYPRVYFTFGPAGLAETACMDCDIVVNSLVGMRGLTPTYKAVLADKDIAFANKETLVAGGSLIMSELKNCKGRLLPVDSEHSAIFQSLAGNTDQKEIRRLILTASGGPFRGFRRGQLEDVTVEQALRHPNWQMGSKITIDSATMMNKGLEIIEAKWLFNVPQSQIDVVVHPQSIVHSMVEYFDGSVIAQLGKPDMKGPIRYALGYPERIETYERSLDFFEEASQLTFEKPDIETFTCLKLARQAISDEESSYPVVLNAANEILVQLFLEKKIKFLDIQNNIEKMLELHQPEYRLDIDQILEIDARTRQEVIRLIL